MQTFLPYKDFIKSFKCLDYRRLGKQRVEAWQILQALDAIKHNEPYGWKHHPAVLMWQGYSNALRKYYNGAVTEWVQRGYRNNMSLFNISGRIKLPPWLGQDQLHSSHRADLLRKDPQYYGQYGWKEQPIQGYYWPVN